MVDLVLPDDLVEVCATGKSEKFAKPVVKSLIRRVNFLKQAKDMKDVYAMAGSFHFEKLKGYDDLRSIRLNKSWRIELVLTTNDDGTARLLVTKLSNHYQ